MPKKYLVYISSTIDDLKAERRELIRIVAEMGAVPVVMDAFDIAREGDRKIIFKAIEECDYFVNLTAHRAGAIAGAPSGPSFAPELEYSCAVKAKVPVLALVIDGKARRKGSKTEKDAAAAKALEAFRKKLEGHACETWANVGELRQKALALLAREMNLNPRRGWVPGTDAAEPAVANELGRLIRENEALRGRVEAEGAGAARKDRGQVGRTLKMLASTGISLAFYYIDGSNWENAARFGYLRLFRLLAPELDAPRTAAGISLFLGTILNPDLTKTVRKEYPTPSNTVKKIMADFALLKLVKSARPAASRGAGENPAWEMTEYGKEAFAAYRLRQMGRALTKKGAAREAARTAAANAAGSAAQGGGAGSGADSGAR
jgi:hypothetical protein